MIAALETFGPWTVGFLFLALATVFFLIREGCGK